MSKFYIVDLDDWKCLYKDGKKILEGHSFGDQELLEACDVGVEVESVECGTPLYEWCEQFGNPPDTLEEVRSIQGV